MANTLSPKVLKVVLANLEKQGCDVEDKKNGYFIKFPDGTSYTFHRSTSDHRAVMNMRAAVRRAGCTWPLDGGR